MKKILVIEDDILIRNNTCEFLKEEGFNVFSAEDGIKGVQVAIEIIPDLIVCDISMPRMDGFEVLKTLQSIPTTAIVPFIFLTAKSQKEDLRRGMQLGADDYITKPFDYDELLKAIHVRFGKHEKIIRANEEKFYALIDNPLTGVYIFNDRTFTYTNAKMCEILGYSKTELEEMCFEDILNPEENNDEALDKIHRCINGLQSTAIVKLHILDKEQNFKSIEVFGTITKIKGKESLIGNIITIPPPPGVSLLTPKNLDVKLSDREIDVLKLICEGMATKEIADKLFLSNRTIDSHRASLIEKTGCRNTADLVMYAVRNQLIVV